MSFGKEPMHLLQLPIDSKQQHGYQLSHSWTNVETESLQIPILNRQLLRGFGGSCSFDFSLLLVDLLLVCVSLILLVWR